MVTKSKLKMALAADKGVDFKKLHLKKKEKVARKGKAKKHGGEEGEPANGKKVEEEWEDVEDEDEKEGIELNEDESGSEEEVDGPMKVYSWFTLSDFHLTVSTD